MDNTKGAEGAGGDRVLVVDDDEAVRSMVARILGREGYAVLEAEDARSALEIADGVDSITLLLTDVVLPGMDGSQLAASIRAESPDIRVVYMSGYEEAELEDRGIKAVGAAYIQKPFTPEVLKLMVRGALDS